MITITLRYYNSDNHFNYACSPPITSSARALLFRPLFSSGLPSPFRPASLPLYTVLLFTTTRFKFGPNRTGETVPGRYAREVKKLAKEPCQARPWRAGPAESVQDTRGQTGRRHAKPVCLTQPVVSRTFKAVSYSRTFNLGARLACRLV